MTDETFILIYYGLVICFLVSLIAAVLVLLSTVKSRRATQRRERDAALARPPDRGPDEPVAPPGRPDA